MARNKSKTVTRFWNNLSPDIASELTERQCIEIERSIEVMEKSEQQIVDIPKQPGDVVFSEICPGLKQGTDLKT